MNVLLSTTVNFSARSFINYAASTYSKNFNLACERFNNKNNLII